jgi:hypothetical protein
MDTAPSSSEGNILEQIRSRPALFLGTRSLSALQHFVNGYSEARRELGLSSPNPLPPDIHDWVAYRLHFRESTSGYVNMVLKRIPDEAQALERFFELVDEHHAKSAKTVAKIRRHPEDCKIRRGRRGPNGEEVSRLVEIPCADEVSVVVFTDDPGFFIVNDDPSCDHPDRIEFCPSFSWLHKPYQADPDFTTVLDQQQFDRLWSESIAFARAFREEGEKILRRAKEQAGGIN